MNIQRVLIRTFDPPSTRFFVGEQDIRGSCPQCEGEAALVRVQTTDGEITSHQAIKCLVCAYFSGQISIIKATRGGKQIG